MLRVTRSLTALCGLLLAPLMAQPRPPAPPPQPLDGERVRRKLGQMRPASEVEKSIEGLARIYLKKGEEPGAVSPFAAGRYLAAADALVRAAEHQQHARQPGPPDGGEATRHLERVYFRLQQSDFLVKQSADANAKTIAVLARDCYLQARQAAEAGKRHAAGEQAKSAEELMHALENLAQSTARVGPPPPPPPAPKPPKGEREKK